jgi:transcriptional regulator with XRE-family HTH domain
MDNILSFILMTPAEITQQIAERCRMRRLGLGFTRDQLAARSGVSAASLKRFERTGNIDFGALIRLALALDAMEGFDQLLAKKTYASLEDVIGPPPRQRGRRARKAGKAA